MDPITRKEMYLSAVAGDTSADALPDPITREELYLSAAAGDTPADALPDPITREEFFLKAIVDNGGGDTPSPSGDPHFSLLLYTDYYTGVLGLMDSENGEYQIPNEQALHGAFSLTLITPVKTIGNHEAINTLSDGIYFTPAANFTIDFDIHGEEITAGDGKLYNIYFDGEEYGVRKSDVDFFALLT